MKTSALQGTERSEPKKPKNSKKHLTLGQAEGLAGREGGIRHLRPHDLRGIERPVAESVDLVHVLGVGGLELASKTRFDLL